MKTFLMSLALLSTSAFAHIGPQSSWSEIKKNYSFNIKWPSARMNHGPSTGVDFLCNAGDHFETLKPIKRCVKEVIRGGRDNDRLECVEWETITGIVEKVQSYEQCVRFQHHRERDICLEYVTKTFVVPTSYKVEVNKITNNREGTERLAFKKQFDIPSCQ